jgi:hypothetical protein
MSKSKKAYRVVVTSPITSSVRGVYLAMRGEIVTGGHERPATVWITNVDDAKSLVKNLERWIVDSESMRPEEIRDPLLDLLDEESAAVPMTAGPDPIPVHEMLNEPTRGELVAQILSGLPSDRQAGR